MVTNHEKIACIVLNWQFSESKMEKENNNNSPNDQPSSSSGGKDSASYNDLAARFENLKNL